jgi:hypothetical protein
LQQKKWESEKIGDERKHLCSGKKNFSVFPRKLSLIQFHSIAEEKGKSPLENTSND